MTCLIIAQAASFCARFKLAWAGLVDGSKCRPMRWHAIGKSGSTSLRVGIILI